MTTKTNASEEDWFENVENLRPLREGRRADTLNEVATGTAKVTADEAERKFLADFAVAESQSDPLETMYQFSQWFEEHFPSGNQKCFYPLLYKICTTYSPEAAYANDERLLKLWLKLADNFPESGLAVMEFAFARGSCRQLAKFYIRWSEMYQSIGWWNKAREKLMLGVQMCAMPLDLLHRAIDELETSVMLVIRDGDSDDEDEFSSDESVQNVRETLGKLRGLGRRHFAPPVVRTIQGTATSSSTTKIPISSKKKNEKLDQFEIFSDDAPPAPAGLGQTTTAHLEVFQTPIGTRPGKKKASRVVESLRDDKDYQTLFGAFDTHQKTDLQLTNEENLTGRTLGVSSSRLPTIPIHTPAQPTFEIFQEEPEGGGAGDKAVARDEPSKEQQLIETAKKVPTNRAKASLKLRKDYVRAMSVEEGFARHVLAQLQQMNTDEVNAREQ